MEQALGRGESVLLLFEQLYEGELLGGTGRLQTVLRLSFGGGGGGGECKLQTMQTIHVQKQNLIYDLPGMCKISKRKIPNVGKMSLSRFYNLLLSLSYCLYLSTNFTDLHVIPHERSSYPRCHPNPVHPTL